MKSIRILKSNIYSDPHTSLNLQELLLLWSDYTSRTALKRNKESKEK